MGTPLEIWLATGVVLLPALAGGLLLTVARARAAEAIGILGSVLALLCAAVLAGAEPGVRAVSAGAPDLFYSIAWRIDAATLALATLIAFAGALVIHFAAAYFGVSEKGRRAIAILSIFEASMLGLVLSDNLFLLFTFWELTGLCSFFLINTDADKRADTFESAQQALIVTVGGGLPMLVGFIALVAHAGTASLSVLVRADIPLDVQTLVLALILPGILTKSAQVPLHFWLPGAMAAPTPISAYLHSATMVKAGVILLLYFFPICGASWLWSTALVPLGVLTCIWGSYRALGQDDIKLLMAWSTVSQLGLMTITAGLGSDLAIRAATLYLFAHALFKAGLFLSIGAIDHAAHTRKLSELGGMRTRTPILFAATATLCGSMAGLPPFAGFLSKELVLEKLMLTDPLIHDVAVIGIVVGSIGTVAYTTRFLAGVFGGTPRSDGAASSHEPGASFLLPPAILAALSLAGGLGARYTDRWLLEPASAALLGAPLGAPELRLWHGINVPLILSFIIIGLGWALHRTLGHHPLPPGPAALRGPKLFADALDGIQGIGGSINRVLTGQAPSVYFALALLAAAAAALPLTPQLLSLTDQHWSVAGSLVLALQAIAVVALVLLRGRVARILLLTAVGFSVALLYRLLHAPDLALTQLLVEVLTTIFFVLATRFLATGQARRGASPTLVAARLVVGVAVGAAGAAIVLALSRVAPDSRLHEAYFVLGPAVADGLNLTNLVLGDFRAIDTAIETMVVLVATFGVAGWLLGRELPSREGDG